MDFHLQQLMLSFQKKHMLYSLFLLKMDSTKLNCWVLLKNNKHRIVVDFVQQVRFDAAGEIVVLMVEAQIGIPAGEDQASGAVAQHIGKTDLAQIVPGTR